MKFVVLNFPSFNCLKRTCFQGEPPSRRPFLSGPTVQQWRIQCCLNPATEKYNETVKRDALATRLNVLVERAAAELSLC